MDAPVTGEQSNLKAFNWVSQTWRCLPLCAERVKAATKEEHLAMAKEKCWGRMFRMS